MAHTGHYLFKSKLIIINNYIMEGLDSPIFDGRVGCTFAGEPGWINNNMTKYHIIQFGLIEDVQPKQPTIDNYEIIDQFIFDE